MSDSAFAIIFIILFVAAIGLFLREQKARKAIEKRFSGVVDADSEERNVRLKIENHNKELEKLIETVNRHRKAVDLNDEIIRLERMAQDEQRKIETVKSEYAQKRMIYQNLLKEISIFDEKLAFAEMGIYEPHFDFSDSEKYKSEILKVRGLQKNLVSGDRAVICTKAWTVDGSQSKGKTMTNRNIRLTLRAFNNECEAAIANIRWNNANAMEKRIVRAQEQIDKLNASNFIFVTDDYLKLKLKELYLTHELREKQKEEREQKAENARAAREEQKLIKEMEEAQREEARYEKLLSKARSEAEKAVGPQLEIYAQKISMLEKDLFDAHAKVERAQAMAEKTRSGYVYIISNVGSFGENVVKIGLTRRLDPTDRVRELGDASVPFLFDTHAIIYSDDAPSLERALHTEFEEMRINTKNLRKEFFKISLEDVEAAVMRIAPDSDFFKDIEAQEYFETLARRKADLLKKEEGIEKFPAQL